MSNNTLIYNDRQVCHLFKMIYQHVVYSFVLYQVMVSCKQDFTVLCVTKTLICETVFHAALRHVASRRVTCAASLASRHPRRVTCVASFWKDCIYCIYIYISLDIYIYDGTTFSHIREGNSAI